MVTKPLAFAGIGAGVVGVPTAIYCAGGGFAKEPTFSSEYSVPSPVVLSMDARTSSLDKVPTDCAGRFFPGVKFGTSQTTGQDGNIPDHNVENGKLMGCALLQLDHKSSTEFAFAAEIAVKTDRVGWAIQVYVNTKNEGSADSSVDSQQRFTYTIFWLTRDASTKKWKVDSGVYVKLISTQDPYESNIAFPNKEILTSGNKAAGISDGNKTWLGVWKETTSNNKRIFEGVKMQYNGNCDSWLNLDAQGNPTCIQSNLLQVAKKYENHTWSDSSGQLSEISEKYRQQLQSKTGTWTWYDDPQTFCGNLKNNNSDSEKKQLLNYCHSYSPIVKGN